MGRFGDSPRPLTGGVPQITGDVSGLRVGVVKEGLDGSVSVERGWSRRPPTETVCVIGVVMGRCEPDVQEACLKAAEALGGAGAHVDTISIPMHADSECSTSVVWCGVGCEAFARLRVVWHVPLRL